jgi:hypothetical protein
MLATCSTDHVEDGLKNTRRRIPWFRLVVYLWAVLSALSIASWIVRGECADLCRVALPGASILAMLDAMIGLSLLPYEADERSGPSRQQENLPRSWTLLLGVPLASLILAGLVRWAGLPYGYAATLEMLCIGGPLVWAIRRFGPAAFRFGAAGLVIVWTPLALVAVSSDEERFVESGLVVLAMLGIALVTGGLQTAGRTRQLG